MIFPDANLLLYAVNTDSPDHATSFAWWRDSLQSGVAVGLYTGVIFAFIRLSTNRRVFTTPLAPREAFAYINNWLAFPAVRLVETDIEDLVVVAKFLASAGTGGNLVSDAQIAAAALRFGATVYSADADFKRFSGIKSVNPID